MVITEQNNSTENIGYNDDYIYYFTSFAATQNYTLTKITLPLLKQGSPGDLEVYLYTTNSNGYPSTQIIKLADITAASVGTTFNWHDSTGTTNIVTGTRYSIVIKPTAPIGNPPRYAWGGNYESIGILSGNSNDLVTFQEKANRGTRGFRIHGTIIASTKGEKELRTKFPVTKGLNARSQKQTGRITNLVPQESKVLQRNKSGI